METIRCAYCNAIIPAEVLRRRHKQPGDLAHCNREHDAARRKAAGFYAAIGAQGNAVQGQVKRQTGQIPQYEKRRAAVSTSNREKPRRKKGTR